MFAKMIDLGDEVMRQAVVQEIARIVAQGLSVGDPIAMDAPLKLKAAAVQWLSDR